VTDTLEPVAPPAAPLTSPEAHDLVRLPTGQPPAGARRVLGIPRGVERLLGVALVLGGWALATNLGWISTQTLPKPGTVAVVGWDLWNDGTLPAALWASVQRVAWGLGIGVTALCPGFVHTNITATSRFAGQDPEAEQRSRDAATEAYRRRNYTPDRVAAKLVRAVEKDLALAPVTAEAHVGLLASRLAPGLIRAIAKRGG